MLQIYRKSINLGLVDFVLIVFLALFAGGCALGTTRVKVTHEPLDRIENKKKGNILVKQFTDKREDTQHIGNKRNAFGMVLGHIGTEEGVKLEALLTSYFAEALKEAGYNAVIQETQSTGVPSQVKFDVIVDGEIVEFWLDLYMAVWHKVGVKVKAIDPTDQKVLWEKDIRGEEKNVLWFGLASEYEKVIRQALTKALNQAAKEFASDEFSKVIKK
jgi:hypothetical protein